MKSKGLGDDVANFTKKTGLNDRLINYTIDIEFAFQAINNIR